MGPLLLYVTVTPFFNGITVLEWYWGIIAINTYIFKVTDYFKLEWGL